MPTITITVYGSEQICASCVGAPSSKDTYEWLQAAIGRKYASENVSYKYIDINKPQKDPVHQAYVDKIIEEDLFYPIVWVNDKMVAEGIPSLKPIYRALDDIGLNVKEA
ncbi:YuzD family protein [Oceanobacillus sp. J11TS1]|uniref:YuzD family protein n=1 Tax=Oceanobacillus sp. J11TS1 TaxID=2807191 RepID=UPI001B199611|nr:YuzD family protein [Oceanobacillus sp. J11TS1]GIO25122.1 disulfide oxidoreductase [Oceanobacillus sp. J11TS1]